MISDEIDAKFHWESDNHKVDMETNVLLSRSLVPPLSHNFTILRIVLPGVYVWVSQHIWDECFIWLCILDLEQVDFPLTIS